MTEEWFDIVDERDRVIGRRLRADVHRLGLLHRAVHILVFNRAGQVFLQKRSLSKDTWPGAWDTSVSGHVDSGEDYDAAATRELGEELGIHNPGPIVPLFDVTACPESGHEFFRVYRTEAEGPFQLHPEEIELGAWLDPDDVDRQIEKEPETFASSFRLLWRETRRRGLV